MIRPISTGENTGGGGGGKEAVSTFGHNLPLGPEAPS